MDVGKVNPLSPSTSDGPSFDQMLNIDMTKANAVTLQDSSQKNKKFLENGPSLKDKHTVTQDIGSRSISIAARKAHLIPKNKPH